MYFKLFYYKIMKFIKNKIYLLILILLTLYFFSLIFPDFIPFKNFLYSQETEEQVIKKVDLLLAQNNKSSAISLLLNSINKFPESTSIPYKLAEIFYNEKVYPLALKYYLTSYKRGKNDPIIYFYIGDCYAYLNKNKSALFWFYKSLKLNSAQPYTIYSIAWILLKNKEYKEAERLLKNAIKRFPNSGYLYGALAVLYANINKIELSRLYYEKAYSISGFQNSSVLLYNRGILEYSFGYYDNAYEYFKKAYDIGDLSEVPLAIGELEYLKGNFDVSLQYYKQSLKNLRSPLILYDLLYLWIYKGNYLKASEYFKKINNFQNNYWIYLYNLHINEYNYQFYTMKKDFYEIKLNYNKKQFYNKFSFNYYIDIIKDYFLKNTFKILAKIYSFSSIKKLSLYNKIEYYKTLKNIFKGISPLYKFYLNKQLYYSKEVSQNLLPQLYLEFIQYYSNKKDLKMFKYYENLFLNSYNKPFDNLNYFIYIEAKTSLYKKIDKNLYLQNLLKLLKISPLYFQFTDFYIPVKVIFKNFTDKKIKKNIVSYIKRKGFKIANSNNNQDYLFLLNIDYSSPYIIFNFTINPFYSSNKDIYTTTFGTTIDKINKDELNFFESLFENKWFFQNYNEMNFHF